MAQHETQQALMCSGRVSRSCSICGTRRVAYVITNLVNSLIQLVTFMKGKGNCASEAKSLSNRDGVGHIHESEGKLRFRSTKFID